MIICGAVLGAPRFLVFAMNNPTPENSPEAEVPATQPQTQAVDPRRRLRELLSVPERDRTDEQWDEIIELEIQTAPGNRISPNEQLGGGGAPGRSQGKSGGGQGQKKHRQQRPGGGSGGGGGNGGGNRRPRQNKQQSGGGNSGGAAPAAS